MSALTENQEKALGVTGTKATPASERLDGLAHEAIGRLALPPHVVPTLINISENATYRLDDPATGDRWALRIHRQGYHTLAAIGSELAWLAALKTAEVARVPTPIPGRDGALVQTLGAGGNDAPRHAVLFAWETGVEPTGADITDFEQLGETAARMHRHVRSWTPPPWFERHVWNFETSLGATPLWGRWRDGPGMTDAIAAVFAETVRAIEKRLADIGTDPRVFHLVHGDMRLANLLKSTGTIKVIDFDDCGFSWFLYDCATVVSFMEDKPEAAGMIAAWARGYRRVASLSAEEEDEIATFVMLRRILLVAWIGSHAETDLARTMGRAFTEATVPLCERYLARVYKARSVKGVALEARVR
jgi:Ser/Thr protein kinase RdoA (MazF antagonist)